MHLIFVFNLGSSRLHMAAGTIKMSDFPVINIQFYFTRTKHIM